ncbi:MAG: hypothetical protein IJC48_04555 [Clostridia bacterium]|nr:hypothetical protein [Clostridia bacterium]
MPINVAFIIGLILALISTVAAYIFFLPEARKKNLNKVLVILHDILNLKDLYLEKIFKALYVFATLFTISAGFFMLFSGIKAFGEFHSFFWYGVAMMFVGPILIRILFEISMLSIMRTKNVIEINKKLKAPVQRRTRPQERPSQPQRRAYDAYEDSYQSQYKDPYQ